MESLIHYVEMDTLRFLSEIQVEIFKVCFAILIAIFPESVTQLLKIWLEIFYREYLPNFILCTYTKRLLPAQRK